VTLKTSTLDNSIGLIEPKGSLVGGDETVELRQAVAGFIERDYQKLIIDLSKVTYVNSTAIGILVAAHTSYARKRLADQDLRHQQEHQQHLCHHETRTRVRRVRFPE